MFNFSLIQVNFINLSKFLHRYIPAKIGHYFFESLIVYKFVILIFVLLLLICFITPEKLKLPSIISFFFIIIIIIALWIKTCTLGFENSSNVRPIIYSNWASLVGNVFYSVEGISSVFTIRSSMQIPIKMGLVTLI